jgi:hypothetical protein
MNIKKKRTTITIHNDLLEKAKKHNVCISSFLDIELRKYLALIEGKHKNLFLSLFAFVMIMGLIISWISTFFAVRKYLKIKTDYLYYY